MRSSIQISIQAAFICVFFSIPVLFPGVSAGEGATATGMSRAFNPSLGVNCLFTGAYSDVSNEDDASVHGGAFRTGFHLQELEIGLTSIVDPYFSAQAALAVHGDSGFEVEEAFVRSRNLPRGLELQLGKCFLPFGKHNLLHTHSFPFLDAPWAHSVLLGFHGLNDVGARLAYLSPLPWFSDFSAAVFYPGAESPFARLDPEDFAVLVNNRNLWELAPTATFEFGFTWAEGAVSSEVLHRLTDPLGHHDHSSDEEEDFDRSFLRILGVDATFKVVSTRNRSWDISIEYLWSRGLAEGSKASYGGITGYGRFQLNRRWWVQARGDLLGIPMKPAEEHEEGSGGEDHLEERDTPWRMTGLLALVLSEFSAVRLQYDYVDRITERPENRIILQLNVTFGAHPAHVY